MVFGGLISILIAIWIYRTAMEAKLSNWIYWVAGSVIMYLSIQIMMIYFNAMIIDGIESDVSSYDNAGGLNSRDSQSGSAGSFMGILFELGTWFVPLVVIAIIRQSFMLKQSFSIKGLFSGIKEMFVGIINSFKTS